MMDEGGPATGEEEEEEEEEMMTSAEVLAKLEEAWRNEKFSPDLLEAKVDLIDCITEQVINLSINQPICCLVHRIVYYISGMVAFLS